MNLVTFRSLFLGTFLLRRLGRESGRWISKVLFQKLNGLWIIVLCPFLNRLKHLVDLRIPITLPDLLHFGLVVRNEGLVQVVFNRRRV